MSTTPLVSVCLTTYNHAPFIEEALDSILCQQTTFEFELLIGEDASTDGTREIVKRYENQYPSIIRAFYHERKDVIYIDGRATGRRNFLNNLAHARGKFIALLDGDDYWTDPNKLEKQVALLNADEQAAICFHPCMTSLPDGKQSICPNPSSGRTFCFNDLLNGNVIPASSTVFRQGLISKLPPWFWFVPAPDWPLHILNAQKGKMIFISEPMSVHRIHSSNIWMNLSKIKQALGKIKTAQCVIGELTPENQQYLKHNINSWWRHLIGGVVHSEGLIRAIFLIIKNKPYRSTSLLFLALKQTFRRSLGKLLFWR